MFWRYVVNSMKFATTQMIASVAGIETSAIRNGTTNAAVPNTKTRMASATGTATRNSPIVRSCEKTGSRSCSIAAWPVT